MKKTLILFRILVVGLRITDTFSGNDFDSLFRPASIRTGACAVISIALRRQHVLDDFGNNAVRIFPCHTTWHFPQHSARIDWTNTTCRKSSFQICRSFFGFRQFLDQLAKQGWKVRFQYFAHVSCGRLEFRQSLAPQAFQWGKKSYIQGLLQVGGVGWQKYKMNVVF